MKIMFMSSISQSSSIIKFKTHTYFLGGQAFVRLKVLSLQDIILKVSFSIFMSLFGALMMFNTLKDLK